MKNETIFIIAERLGGILQPVTHEMISLARALRGQHDVGIQLVMAGTDVTKTGRALCDATGLDVHVLDLETSTECPGEAETEAISKFLKPRMDGVRWILAANTTCGIPLAASLTGALPASCIPAVSGFRADGDNFAFTRNFYGGKISGWLTADVSPCILLVQPGSFPAQTTGEPGTGEIHIHPSPAAVCRCRSLGLERPASEGSGLEEADVVVAAGNGIGEEDNLALVRQTAALFAKSAVGGSRIVCDQGWLPHGRQIGVTGKTVRPALYIACGISGATQHVQGMSGSGFIVSVNRDPGAAIFNFSDICIVEDLQVFLPALIDAATQEPDVTVSDK